MGGGMDGMTRISARWRSQGRERVAERERRSEREREPGHERLERQLRVRLLTQISLRCSALTVCQGLSFFLDFIRPAADHFANLGQWLRESDILFCIK